jgi:hypothetical protein
MIAVGQASRWSLVALLTLAAIVCAACIGRVALILPLHVSLDPDEGWNAYHAAAAVSGHPLYPDAHGLLFNNYPPLSFYIVGALGALTGDNIIAGRVISLAAFLAVCVAIVAAVRRMDGDWAGAILAALTFAVLLLLGSDYVGMDDPQLLGHALDMAALLLILRRARSKTDVSASALLFVLAGLVKHDLFPLPLAVGAWLLWQDRRNGWVFALAGLFFALVALATFRLAFGFDLLQQLNSARAYEVFLLRDNLVAWAKFAGPAIVVAVLLAFPRRRDPWVGFCVIYAAIAVAAGTFFFGGAGVDVNAMFDADLALALGAGVLVGRLGAVRAMWANMARPALAMACLLPPALQAFLMEDNGWQSASFWTQPLQDDATQARDDIAFLHSRPGNAVCESLAYCYWADKKAEIDVFNLNQALLAHSRDIAPLLRLVAARLQSALAESYRVDHQDDEGVFLVPK